MANRLKRDNSKMSGKSSSTVNRGNNNVTVNESIDQNILKDFASIMHNKDLSDFKFMVSGREFFVHKNILSARSTVFAAMFSADMIEKRENCAQIDDIDADVFEQLLHFIYTGKALNIKAMAKKLLSAAEMYNIVQLKSKCEDIICSKLNDANAISTLIFADRYNALKLRDRVIEYIAKKFATIRTVKAIEWKAFIGDKHASLVDKVFEAIGNNQRKPTIINPKANNKYPKLKIPRISVTDSSNSVSVTDSDTDSD